MRNVFFFLNYAKRIKEKKKEKKKERKEKKRKKDLPNLLRMRNFPGGEQNVNLNYEK